MPGVIPFRIIAASPASAGFRRSCKNDNVIDILILGKNMKQRILPGAAGLIALTATIGFIDGHREMEIESYSRNRITLVSVHSDRPVNSVLAINHIEIKLANPAYLVEISRGDTTAEVKIDAFTGRIIPA
jgi:hypothetical protein